MKVIRCGGCGAYNRIPRYSLRRVPVCGRCRQALPEPRWLHGVRWLLQVRVGLLTCALGVAGGAWLYQQTLPVPAMLSAGLGLLPLLAALLSRLDHPGELAREAVQARQEPPGSDLEPLLERLIHRAWGPREATQNRSWQLTPAALHRFGTEARLITALLDHVRRVTPELTVPMLTPRLLIEDLPQAAGQFVEQDGWVKIVVDRDFFLDLPAARAILCHEVCHYVLEANGIRDANTAANERLTEVAMFVFGLGEVFLAGYHRVSDGYRAGHRLGYLSAAEYRYVRQRVADLRRSGELQPTLDEVWERRLRAAIPNAAVRRRLLQAQQAKYLTKTQAELIQQILDEYQRDCR